MNDLIAQILNAMQPFLSQSQMQKLENVMIIKTRGLTIQKEETSLVPTEEKGWKQILETYLLDKRLENCSEGTIENYRRCITTMMSALKKDLKDITADDLKYYYFAHENGLILSMKKSCIFFPLVILYKQTHVRVFLWEEKIWKRNTKEKSLRCWKNSRVKSFYNKFIQS